MTDPATLSKYGSQRTAVEHPKRVNADGSVTLLCGAKSKRTGNPCRAVAGYGTDHLGFGLCKYHTGTSAVGRTVAAREAIVDKIEKMTKLGQINDMIGPEQALMEEVGRAAAAVAYFDHLVAEEPDPTTERAQILIDQWNEQRRMSVQTSQVIVRAGIAKRQVQIQEMQAKALVQVVLAVVGAPEMGLDSEQQMIARKLMAAKLRELSAIDADSRE